MPLKALFLVYLSFELYFDIHESYTCVSVFYVKNAFWLLLK